MYGTFSRVDLSSLGAVADLVGHAIETDAGTNRLVLLIVALTMCGVLLRRAGS